MLSLSLFVGKTPEEELERNSATVVAKLKAKLNESASSLKAMLEAMRSLMANCAKLVLKLVRLKKM